MALEPFDPVKPALKQLHWLSIEHRIQYKLCLLMHFVQQYVTEIVATVAHSSARSGLGSDDMAAYVKPGTRTKFGERDFCLPVQSPGTAYRHIFTVLQML